MGALRLATACLASAVLLRRREGPYSFSLVKMNRAFSTTQQYRGLQARRSGEPRIDKIRLLSLGG